MEKKKREEKAKGPRKFHAIVACPKGQKGEGKVGTPKK